MKKRLLRRQGVISGRADKMEQRAEREKFAKPVTVLTAQELKPSSPAILPPEVSESRSRLPSIEMSEDGRSFQQTTSSDRREEENYEHMSQSQIKLKYDKQENANTRPHSPMNQPKDQASSANPLGAFETVSCLYRCLDSCCNRVLKENGWAACRRWLT